MIRAIFIACAIAVIPSSTHANRQDLPGWSVVETAHFRFHFPPMPTVNAAAFSERQERVFEELRRIFGSAPVAKIDFHVWNEDADGERALGRPLAFARPDLSLIHTSARHTPGHELAHVFVHHVVQPEKSSIFLEEGTAVSLDASGRNRLTIAHTTARQGPPVTVAGLWEPANASADPRMYPIAGAFVDRLVARGGRDNFLKLLKHQTMEHARAIYGAAAFDRIVTEFEADLLREQPPAATAGQTSPPQSPALERLRQRAQERMRKDALTYSREQFQEIERVYQSANGNLRAPAARSALLTLLEKYPKSNRTGCGVLYLAQISQGEEKERFLKLAIENHEDAMYGDGTQVGAFARAQLASLYAQTNRMAGAKVLVGEITSRFPDAVDHSGVPIVDTLKRMKLIE